MINSIPKTEITFDILTRKIISYAVQNNFSYAVWRKPGESVFYILVCDQHENYPELHPENLPSGFAFAPFDPSLNKLFLKASLLLAVDPSGNFETLAGSLPNIESDLRKTQLYYSAVNEKEGLPDFETLAANCIAGIKQGKFEKIVASRTKLVELNDGADPINMFDLMASAYNQALVYLVGIPVVGTWLGASPEPLISLDSNNIFRTVALAGTRSFDPDIPISQVTWKQKEIEEQALVERYIISCFKKIRIREYEEYGPKTYRAGNLLHLKSDFLVDMNQVKYPDLLTVMLRLLHPTSAVCGMPLQESLEFLKKHEGYDRSFYSGFLGPINVENETHIFVNLRCLKWFGTSALLYAGAGITADSDPASELRESEMKMETLNSLLKKL